MSRAGRSRGRSRLPRRGRARRGTSELVGALILGSILMTTVVAYTGTVIQSNHLTNVAAEGRLRMDHAQEAERFNVTSALGPGGFLGVHVANLGSQPLQIVYVIAIRNTDGSVCAACLNSTPYTVNPGTSTAAPILTGLNFGDPANSPHVYTLKVVTSRGNIGDDLYPHPGPALAAPENIGFLVIQFDQLQFAQRATSNGSWDDWRGGWNLPRNRDTVWRVNVTNLRDRPIEMDELTLILMFDPGSSSNEGWWIVSANLTNASVDPYTTTNTNLRLATIKDYPQADNSTLRITIPAKGWRWLYFSGNGPGSACSPGGVACNAQRSPATVGLSFAFNILFYGFWEDIDTEPYAQTTPYPGVRTVA